MNEINKCPTIIIAHVYMYNLFIAGQYSIILGERNAGKSTLINKILGASVLLTRNYESSTIIKMRNSESMMIQAQHNSGLTEMKDLTSYNISDPKTLRIWLKDLQNRESICSIDVGYPFSFLKVQY